MNFRDFYKPYIRTMRKKLWMKYGTIETLIYLYNSSEIHKDDIVVKL